jgi:hypothetical protein
METVIRYKDIRFLLDLKQFDPMSIINIESLTASYRVWYRDKEVI